MHCNKISRLNRWFGMKFVVHPCSRLTMTCRNPITWKKWRVITSTKSEERNILSLKNNENEKCNSSGHLRCCLSPCWPKSQNQLAQFLRWAYYVPQCLLAPTNPLGSPSRPRWPEDMGQLLGGVADQLSSWRWNLIIVDPFQHFQQVWQRGNKTRYDTFV